MTELPFNNREIDAKLHAQNEEMKVFIKDLITPLTAQVTYTNGKLRRQTTIMIIVATATIVLLFTNGSELANFALKII